jgi:hypothetical protein
MPFQIVLALSAIGHEMHVQWHLRELEAQLSQFPPVSVAEVGYDLSWDHVLWLEAAGAAIAAHRRDAYEAQLSEARRMLRPWQFLALARKELYQVRHCAYRWQRDNRSFDNKSPESLSALLEDAELWIHALERKLGEEDFRAGRMPPPVPIWRFQWID